MANFRAYENDLVEGKMVRNRMRATERNSPWEGRSTWGRGQKKRSLF